ncbi:hypothetical protein ACHAQA_002093 [Verticillium albo-atrum]
MSSFIARSALRATQRRQFSLLTNMRNMARTFEPHPFQRMTTAQAAKPDYAKMFKGRILNATIYLPLMCAMLGWPYAAALAFDGRM